MEGKAYGSSEGGIGGVLKNGCNRRVAVVVAVVVVVRRRGLRRWRREDMDEIGAEEEYR